MDTRSIIPDSEAAVAAFVGQFRRSKKGNLTCQHATAEGTLTLTVFEDKQGGYNWSINRPEEGVEFGPGGNDYPSEYDALEGLHELVSCL